MAFNRYYFVSEVAAKNPCRKDCPERKGGCAVNCERWKSFEAWKQEQYKQNLKKKMALQSTPGMQKRVKADEKSRRVGRKHMK